MIRYYNPPRWLQNEIQLEIFSNGVTQKQQVFWIARQNKRTGEPIEDIIPLVKKFEKYRQSKNVTGKDADINSYKNVGDLNRVITYIEMPEWQKGLDFKAEVDTLGTFGEWTILFPKTIRGSMACDPNDITSWCTVRKSGGNLFLSYVGRPKDDTSLYYVVSNDPQKMQEATKGWFSIGTNNSHGTIISGKRGGMTIDGAQNAFTEERMHEAFGQNYDVIINTIKDHSYEIGLKHPAKEQLRKMGKSASFLEKSMKGFSRDDKKSILSILAYYPLSRKVIEFLLLSDYLPDDINDTETEGKTVYTIALDSILRFTPYIDDDLYYYLNLFYDSHFQYLGSYFINEIRYDDDYSNKSTGEIIDALWDDPSKVKEGFLKYAKEHLERLTYDSLEGEDVAYAGTDDYHNFKYYSRVFSENTNYNWIASRYMPKDLEKLFYKFMPSIAIHKYWTLRYDLSPQAKKDFLKYAFGVTQENLDALVNGDTEIDLDFAYDLHNKVKRAIKELPFVEGLSEIQKQIALEGFEDARRYLYYSFLD